MYAYSEETNDEQSRINNDIRTGSRENYAWGSEREVRSRRGDGAAPSGMYDLKESGVEWIRVTEPEPCRPLCSLPRSSSSNEAKKNRDKKRRVQFNPAENTKRKKMGGSGEREREEKDRIPASYFLSRLLYPNKPIIL